MPDNKILMIYALLTVFTFAAFWNVNHCDFVSFDDPVYITGNTNIQDGFTISGIKWAFTIGYAANWHPLTWMSHMLDVQLFGLNPRWHHIMNLLFHIANTLLLFFVLHRMTKALWRSAFVAALFALHPLHVESVAWVAERKDVLSTFFWMLTMCAYCYYVEHPGLRRYLSVILFFVLGLMAKPMLVTLPIVLLLLDYWPLRRFGLEGSNSGYRWAMIRPILTEKIPLFAMSALSSAITYIAQQKGGTVQSIEGLPLAARISNAFVSYAAYIAKMIWPDNLAVFYPYKNLVWTSWEVLGAGLLLIVFTLIFIREARRFLYLIVGWLWYLCTLVPVSGLVQVGSQARADRYTYIPLIGLFMIAAWGIPELLEKWRYRRKVLFTLSALTIICFFIMTWKQICYWKDSFALYEHALHVTDNNDLLHYNRGNDYAAVGDYKKAILDYDKAIAINPKYIDAYTNRGNAYAVLGNYRRATENYDRAIELNPKYAVAYRNRAASYISLGDKKKAYEDLQAAAVLEYHYKK